MGVSFISSSGRRQPFPSRPFPKRAAKQLWKQIASPVPRLLSNQIYGSLVSRAALSHHFYELIFETPEPLRYIPGQHVYLEAAPGEWRSYSIVSSQGNRFTLVIDSNPGGVGSRFAMEAPLGTVAKLRLPTGTLRVHDSGEKSLVFVATGCGITPFFAMLRNLASTSANGKQTTLLWGILEERDEFSSRYLGEAAKQMDFSVIPCVSGPISPRIRDRKDKALYLPGDPKNYSARAGSSFLP